MKVLYIILLAAAAVFYPLFKGDLSFVLLCTLLLFPVIMLIMLFAASKAVKIRIKEFGSSIVRGEKLQIKINVKNPLPVPVSCCAVTVMYSTGNGSFDKYTVMVPLKSRSSETVSVSITPEHCGGVECVIKKAVIYDLIGLFSKKIKLDIRMSAAVMPKEYPFGETELSPAAGNRNERALKLSAGSSDAEVSGLRDYRDGDRINSIHWKLSSRSEDFIVKDYSQPVNGNILVIADVCASSDPGMKDRVMDVYYSLAKALISAGNEVKSLMNDDGLSLRKASDAAELDAATAEQVRDQFSRERDMSLAALLSGDTEKLGKIYAEKFSRMIIITPSEKKDVLSELEENIPGTGITVLNVGKRDAAEENKNSDVIIYDLWNGGEIEIPEHIAV